MAITLKTGDRQMFIINSYLTQHRRELKSKIKIKTSGLQLPASNFQNDMTIILNKKHTIKLANYLLDILYQCGYLNEIDLISKKGKYKLYDKSFNKDYLIEKGKNKYKNPFKKV